MKKYSRDWYWYYAINSVLVILILFPLYWTFISSVKKPDELITSEPTFYPHTWTWQYYDRIWNYDTAALTSATTATNNSSKKINNTTGSVTQTIGIDDAFTNSVIVSVGTIIFSIIVSTFAGYGLTFFRIPFKEVIFILLILPILVPAISLIIPIYKLLKGLGLTDSYLGLIFLHTTAMLPIGVFMMRNAFSSIPNSLREVALLEGTSELRIINSPEKTMLNIALAKIAMGGSQFEMKWGSLTAGSMISFIPIIIFYTLLQRYFVRGITGSAVKE